MRLSARPSDARTQHRGHLVGPARRARVHQQQPLGGSIQTRVAERLVKAWGSSSLRPVLSGRAWPSCPACGPSRPRCAGPSRPPGRSPPTRAAAAAPRQLQQPLAAHHLDELAVLITTRRCPAKGQRLGGVQGAKHPWRGRLQRCGVGCQPSPMRKTIRFLEQRGPGKKARRAAGKEMVRILSGRRQLSQHLLKGFHRLPTLHQVLLLKHDGRHRGMPCAWICCSAAATSSANRPLSSTSRVGVGVQPHGRRHR